MKRMITRDDLAKWKARPTLHLDGEGFYRNYYKCDEEPRLTYVDSGPAGNPRFNRGHKRTFYVDGIECPGIDAVLTMLNAEPVAK